MSVCFGTSSPTSSARRFPRRDELAGQPLALDSFNATAARIRDFFELREIRQPVEIFYGNEDGIISPRMPLYLSDQLPSAIAHEWDGANHYSFVDKECWIDSSQQRSSLEWESGLGSRFIRRHK